MKELLAILQALHNAQDALSRHEHSNERDPKASIDELQIILDSEELHCALRRIEANVGSPLTAPAPAEKACIAG